MIPHRLAFVIPALVLTVAAGAADARPSGAATTTFIELTDAGIAPFATSDGGVATLAKAPSGERAILLEKGWIEVDRVDHRWMDWSGYDLVHVDVFNPDDKAAPVYVEVRDATSVDFQTRVNHNTSVPPGRSTITFPTTMYTNEKAHPGRPLDPHEIHRLVLTTEAPPLYFVGFRLERLDTAGVAFDGLRALSFGPADAPVCEGFTRVSMATRYAPDRGYGWAAGSELWREWDMRQPDLLAQSFVCPQAGSFRVDLPNGTYHVAAIIDSPGGFWGEVQFYRRRTVTANGRTWIDETMDFAEAKRRYFQNAGREDLPGVDPLAVYVRPKQPWRHTSVEVADGALDLGFASTDKYGWTFCLSGLVIYPEAKAEDGERFLAWADERRKAQFDNYFKQVTPPRTGEAPPAAGYRLFTRLPEKLPGAHDGPAAGEAIDAKGLAATAARGEEVPVVLCLQPGEDLGAIDLRISPLKDSAGAALDAAALEPGWFDFRIGRIETDGSSYGCGLRYWHPTPALAAPGVTRTFWIRARIPAAAAAGVYRGTITVKPQKGPTKEIPLAITVRPFALDPITDVAVGPWGCGIGVPWYGCQYTAPIDHESVAWNQRLFAQSLDVIRAAGCTSLSGLPTLRVTAKDGAITIDTSRADEEMKLLRAKGFTGLISSYGVEGMGYRLDGDGAGPDEAAAKQAGFPDAAAFIAALYRAIDEHAVAHDWLPVAWNLCDEPSGPAVLGAVKNALAHRQALAGLKRTTFMGATSMEGDDPSDPHAELIKALPIPSLNLHDGKSLALVHAAGNKPSFYNGGSRLTFGRYLKMLVVKHDLVLRLTWHFNANSGDPYYALDCREDDYCWYNSDAEGRMVPCISFLANVLPGLNDYRYLTTLQRLLREQPAHAAAKPGQAVFDRMIALEAGKDRYATPDFAKDRAEVIAAIEAFAR